MNQINNKYDWKELRTYLESFIKAQVEKDMADPEFVESSDYPEFDSRKNAVENLRDSLTIIFPRELINIEI